MNFDQYQYVGNELDLFKAATHWKTYWAEKVLPLIGNTVVEVGAGLGANTAYLCRDQPGRWLCLEPDQGLAARLSLARESGTLPSRCSVQSSRLRDVDPRERFDTVLYIDVLEHVDDDRGELAEAARRLHPGGRIIVLSPAHQWLFSPFDRTIGHFRRYTLSELADLAPASVQVELGLYLDSAGLLASAANRFLLGASMPTERQILFWDRYLVPLSRRLDRALRFRVGKSALMVWRKPGPG